MLGAGVVPLFFDFDGSVDVVQISLALFAGAFAVMSAWIAFRGQSKESFVSETKALVEGQGARVSTLESRLDIVEGRLAATQFSLRREVVRSATLVTALELSIFYLESVEKSFRDKGKSSPYFPRLDELKLMVEEFKAIYGDIDTLIARYRDSDFVADE